MGRKVSKKERKAHLDTKKEQEEKQKGGEDLGHLMKSDCYEQLSSFYDHN